MNTSGMLLIALSALMTGAANLLLRAGVLKFGDFSLATNRIVDGLIGLSMQPFFVLGVIFYGLAAIVWFSALSKAELSTGYPILVGLTFVLVASGSSLFFGETLSVQKLFGMAMILGGIAVIAHV
ncbi:DMT family transporter [Marinobacterium aestuariivivens]|uniref:DMT family transporter n=1 Tax=Marinobacterium aestuariivivens TaxID=1698799 RepID=A0ABW1ZUM8_9GAMM